MNTIYAYTTATYREKSPLPWLKVGQTHQDSAEERVSQQDGTAVPEPLEIEQVWTVPDTITDKMIHRQLKKMGRFEVRADKKREWIECTVDEVSVAINTLLHGSARPNSWNMREEQQECVDMASNRLRQGNQFLINGKMRLGKTFVSYQIAKKLDSKHILVLTYKPAVKDGWADDLNNHVDFDGWVYADGKDGFKKIPRRDTPEYDEIMELKQKIYADIIASDEGARKNEEERLKKLYAQLRETTSRMEMVQGLA